MITNQELPQYETLVLLLKLSLSCSRVKDSSRRADNPGGSYLFFYALQTRA